MHWRVKLALTTGTLLAGSVGMTATSLAGPDDTESLVKPPGSGGIVISTPTSGAEQTEAGPAGDPDGIGKATLRLIPDQAQVCFTISHSRIAPTQLGHVHEAPRGSNNVYPAVTLYNSTGVASEIEGCTAADPLTLQAIAANPQRFYVAEHSSEYPSGAVRGQFGD